ncbi:hypothetical protein J1605_017335 [Eschrichtius robustus]|uniref:Uncharacterized protein n=1 Tax=Eschrichtius robustus TaxID=9764 RepID=A0AB34HYZ5_ESCRO|nr:hypothetical protein J1605_017335 [Eschrichtius robustus]
MLSTSGNEPMEEKEAKRSPPRHRPSLETSLSVETRHIGDPGAEPGRGRRPGPPPPQGRGMGRVQLFEVRLSHGRVVYSPGEPLAGAVRVRLAAPLPFRGGRGVREGPHLRRAGRGSEAARGRWARDPRGRGRASGCGERRGAAGRAADRGGGRPAAVGAEQGGPGGPVLPHLPFLSSPPRAVQTRGAGFEPVYFAEGHSDLDPRRL